MSIIRKSILASLSIFAFLCSVQATVAHPMLPEPVLQFLGEERLISEDDVDVWFQQNSEYNDEDTRDTVLEFLPIRNEEYLRYLDTQGKTDDSFSDTLRISVWENIFRFTKMGIIHILEGADHVLFVLSLLLVPLAWRRLLKIITTFTVAHSVTLILAGTDILTLSASIVEPIIALSIAYVAMTSVFLRHIPFFRSPKNSIVAVFLFGLFHGLGFAGVFKDIGIPAGRFLSSLISFNVGVEIGQIIIVFLALPVLLLIRKHRSEELIIKTCAIAMSALALTWFAMRII